MINGYYLSTMGALTQLARHDVTANNLANVDTTGFKRDTVSFKSVPTEGILNPTETTNEGYLSTGGGQHLHRITTAHSPGAMKKTDGIFDMAIADDGYFEVANNQGGRFYTRDGAFRLNEEGDLVTNNGKYHVLSPDGGVINLGGNLSALHVNDNGVILNAQEQIGQVGVFRFPEAQKRFPPLRKMGENLYSLNDGATNPIADEAAKVKSGMIEGSNVNAARELVAMIDGLRTYEMNMRVLQIQDEALGRTINDVPGVR